MFYFLILIKWMNHNFSRINIHSFIRSCLRQVLGKKFSLCHKFKFWNPYIFAIWWCKSLIFQTYLFNQTVLIFCISKVYDTGLQRYLDKKISICGKNSILLEILSLNLRRTSFQWMIVTREVVMAADKDGTGQLTVQV